MYERFYAYLKNIFKKVFLDEINLPEAIARNQALKENVFMMIMCVQLKIPLFIIGKSFDFKLKFY